LLSNIFFRVQTKSWQPTAFAVGDGGRDDA